MNPMKLVQLKPQIKQFRDRHPKFIQFFASVGRSGIREGSVLEVSITDPDGKKICTNMKLSAEDMKLIEEVTAAMKN